MDNLQDLINSTYEYFINTFGLNLQEDQIIDILVFFGKVEE